MALYKHLESVFADALIKKGSIRIGTLYEYRDQEKHGEGILDPEEGVRRGHSIRSGIFDENTKDPYLRRFFKASDGGQIILDNTKLMLQESSPNMWMYCVSEACDKKVSEGLSKNYDACVELLDPMSFTREIRKNLSRKLGHTKIERTYWLRCKYIGRDFEAGHYDKHEPFLLKEERFAHQQEVRSMFVPQKDIKIEPIVIEIPNLKKYVRRVF